MKKHLLFLILEVFIVASSQAQFAKPLRNRNHISSNKSLFSVGVTGSYAANDMIYTAVNKSILTPYLAPTFGLAVEWNTMNSVSIGLDASYAMHGAREVFATEFLTSYTTSTFARVHYTMVMNGVEARFPITYYFGYDESIKPYLYVAPRFTLWLNGDVKWERSYDDESYAPLVYESELNDVTIDPYDLSAVAGVGLCTRILINRTQLYVKFDLSYGLSVLNNFSQHEEAEDIEFQGWGDIEHETLGKRYLQNVEARLTLMMPLRKRLKDACAFDQKMKKGK